jgi:hypothetical protein
MLVRVVPLQCSMSLGDAPRKIRPGKVQRHLVVVKE